ncbi:MAG: GNAT family N-acetyltransferase [Thermocrispum sp.]
MSISYAAGDQLTAAQLYALLRLRVDVFVVEQEAAYPELDGRDLLPSTHHFWLPGDGERLAGCLRLLDEDGLLRIGRVCTSKDARGSGVGVRLMDAVMPHIGDRESVLESQTYAAGFYARYGYVPEGEEFTDDDGIPHILMRRRPPAGSVTSP